MKKIIILITAISIAVLIGGCSTITSSNIADEQESESPLVEIFDNDDAMDDDARIKEVYADLKETAETLSDIGDTIQKAWHWAIYVDDDDFTFSNGYFPSMAEATGIDAGELAGTALHIYGMDMKYSINDFQVAVPLAISTMSKEFESCSDSLTSSKESIQKCSDDAKNYDDIKDFYTTALTYYEWLESPSGNFSQASSTIDEYNNELRQFISKLSFDYE